MTRLEIRNRAFRPCDERLRSRRAERAQHGRPQRPGASLRALEDSGRNGGARLQLHRHWRNPDRRHSSTDAAAVRGTAAAGLARRFHHRRQSRGADRRPRLDPWGGLRGARALSRPGALHQHRQVGLGRDRLRQLDIGIRLERRQIFLRQRHDERQKAGFRRGSRHLQDDRRRARSVRDRLWPTRRNARRRHLWRLPALPDRADDHCPSSGRTTFMFQPTIMSTTAARS